MNNISDFFRDPRLDNFDDPQVGVAQLDDLMDPPTDPKVNNRMARFYYTSLGPSTTQKFPNIAGGAFDRNLELAPDYWILRVHSSAAVINPIIVSREGGDDIGFYLGIFTAGIGNYSQERRFILPGGSRWLQVSNPAGGTLYISLAAIKGYNPNDIF